ncbi:hypothetical protein GCM10010363_32850 [Streptomyces omiyaensis]|nr:hypothetical protein GCM10010363_32850 [Streptomyces omiyaensis]
MGDVPEVGRDEAAEAGQGSKVVHGSSLGRRRPEHGAYGRGLPATPGTRRVNAARTLRAARPGGTKGVQVSTLRKRVFVLARESARVQHVAGTRKRTGTDKRTWLSW